MDCEADCRGGRGGRGRVVLIGLVVATRHEVASKGTPTLRPRAFCPDSHTFPLPSADGKGRGGGEAQLSKEEGAEYIEIAAVKGTFV